MEQSPKNTHTHTSDGVGVEAERKGRKNSCGLFISNYY